MLTSQLVVTLAELSKLTLFSPLRGLGSASSHASQVPLLWQQRQAIRNPRAERMRSKWPETFAHSAIPNQVGSYT
eukprot:347247-Amphidinium_carterae.1